MAFNHQSFLRVMLGLALGAGALQPLHAQLDPKLQPSSSTNPTDFLDLYQQSTSLKAKPEIATIFDCSGSMNSLMFHPLYVNADTQDADDYRYMIFTLTPKNTSGVTPAGNVYKVQAATANGCSATAYDTVTVNPSGTATVAYVATTAACTAVSGAPSYTVTATAQGNNSASTTVKFTATTVGSSSPWDWSTYTVSASAPTNSGTYSFVNAGGTQTPNPVIAVSPVAGSYAYGTTLTLTVYLNHPFNAETEPIGDKNITWSCSGGSCTGTVWTEVTANLLYKSVTTWIIPTATQTQINATRLNQVQVVTNVATGTFAASGTTFPAGSTLTFNTYFITPGTSTKINWTTANNNGATYIPAADLYNPTGTPTTPVPQTSYNASDNVTWVIPPYNSATSGGVTTQGSVAVTLDATVSAYMTANGIAAAGALSAVTDVAGDATSALRKPDGTAVKAADANAVTAGLVNTAAGELDVRNWIRAASHVRFKQAASGRTIDIPIPWKNTTPSTPTPPSTTRVLSTGVPLSSTTVLDQEVVVTTANGQTVTTTYGSSMNIELDQTYKIEDVAGAVFSAHANATDFNGNALTTGNTNSVYLSGVVYRPAYISWLFLGKYQSVSTLPYYNAAYTGKYIAFDAASAALVGGQSLASWGQGYGPTALPWGNISVSQYNSAGTYTGSANADGSTYMTPALTRLQAVKSAAIGTWIAHQADVFWAFRELDPFGEAQWVTNGPGSATQINDISTTNLAAWSAAAPTKLLGNDSGWTVLNNYLGTDSTTTGAGTGTVTVLSSPTGHSVFGMDRIGYLFANSETPLTYAMARTLAQYEDPSSAFNVVEGANTSQCVNSFLLLFTDGVDNNGVSDQNNPNATTPYILTENSVLTLDAKKGNGSIITNPTNINPTGLNGLGVPTSGTWWNIFTFAGIAAHLSDPTLGVSGTDFMPQGTPPTVLSSPSNFMPFAINQRGSGANLVHYNKDHRVTVMTVGVSLGGSITSGPKQNLFWAAVCGDPATTTGALTTFHTFVPPVSTNASYPTGSWPTPWAGAPNSYPPNYTPNDWVYNPQDISDYPAVGMRATGAVYFFDATNPTLLSSDMSYAFKLAIGSPSNNATSNPNLPFIGASLGQEVYLGSFQPPAAGGVIWPGDLMMFSTLTSSGVTSLVDPSGNPVTALNSSTAQWYASRSMTRADRLWSSRKLYTRFPATNNSTEMPLATFTVSGAAFTAGTDPIFNYVAKGQPLATQQAVLEFAAGGDTSTIPPTANRSTIMGDIIDSAPAAVEYNWNDVASLVASNSVLSAVGGNRFRLIIVGDNQGWVHGFGEVTKTYADPANNSLTLTKGDVDELWAFMPTDFLANLQYITQTGNPHRFMADGSPSIYFLDLPVSGNGPGTGKVTLGISDRAIAVVGLGKGGRSYYALNILYPFAPTLQWSIVPDEIAASPTPLFPSSRILSSVTYATNPLTVMANMGFSSCVPAFGRITVNNQLRDAVFLGGGFSEPQVDANYPAATQGLGRSALALDVYTGAVLASTALPAGTINTVMSGIGAPTTTPGPVGAGLIPFEYIFNSAMAQRAYFLDYYGGLWAWGGPVDALSTGSYTNFRDDTAELTKWTLRKVFQDTTTAVNGSTAYSVAKYTTAPAPFRVSNFQGPAASSSSATPTAAAVAFESGDRNNPLDRFYGTSQNPVTPDHHQLTVVFDRQDSAAFTSLNLDTKGIDFAHLVPLPTTAVTSTPSSPCSVAAFADFTPGCTNYFLGTATSPLFGYYVNFPSISATTGYIPKGINPPIVVAGSLSYSYFTPLTSDPCTGGTGTTSSYLIADVMHPIVNDQRTGQANPSGLTMSWDGVASNFIAVGTTSVIQAGSVAASNPPPGASVTTPKIQTTAMPSALRYPKVKVWRTVQ